MNSISLWIISIFLLTKSPPDYIIYLQTAKENTMNDNNICLISHNRSSDLICNKFVYEETDANANKRYTETYILGLAVEGVGTLRQGNKAFEIEKGYAFFVQKNGYFSIERNDSLKYFYISFYGRRADELADRFALSESFCVFDLKDSYDDIAPFAFNCLGKADKQNADLFGECVLLYLLTHLDNKKVENEGLLSKMISLTGNNFTSPAFSLGALATALGYNPKYLSFYFKKSKGIRFSDYLRDIRVKHAAFLIERGIISVKNIALLSGFDDVLYFSKVFKKVMGTSPKEYMATVSEAEES